MSVFILIGKVDFEFEEILGVYSTLDLAKKADDLYDQEMLSSYDSFKIQEWESDSGWSMSSEAETTKYKNQSPVLLGGWS